MRAITLWRPWPFALFYDSPLAKDVENRTWPPPARILGQRIAIHAGKKYDHEAAEDIADMLDLSVLPPEAEHGGIVGVVTIDRFIRGGRCGYGQAIPRGDPAFKSMWFFGPYGWVLTDKIALLEPIPCRGAQGLWTVPPDVERLVLEQIK
jgi:hypothetical protein